MLWMFQRVFFGEVTNEKNAKLKDLNLREILVFIPLIVMIFWMGVYSKPFVARIEPSVAQFVGQMNEVRQAMSSDASAPQAASLEDKSETVTPR
jgi:NADH:ubiquinone oxidoreductase subunit 4 (chain M)